MNSKNLKIYFIIYFLISFFLAADEKKLDVDEVIVRFLKKNDTDILKVHIAEKCGYGYVDICKQKNDFFDCIINEKLLKEKFINVYDDFYQMNSLGYIYDIRKIKRDFCPITGEKLKSLNSVFISLNENQTNKKIERTLKFICSDNYKSAEKEFCTITYINDKDKSLINLIKKVIFLNKKLCKK